MTVVRRDANSLVLQLLGREVQLTPTGESTFIDMLNACGLVMFEHDAAATGDAATLLDSLCAMQARKLNALQER